MVVLTPGIFRLSVAMFWPRQLVETAVGRKPIPSTGGVSTRILFLGPLPVFLFGISFVWSCCCLMECLPFCLVWFFFSLAVKCGWDVLPQCCAVMVTNSIRRYWKRSNLPWVPLKKTNKWHKESNILPSLLLKFAKPCLCLDICSYPRNPGSPKMVSWNLQAFQGRWFSHAFIWEYYDKMPMKKLTKSNKHSTQEGCDPKRRLNIFQTSLS